VAASHEDTIATAAEDTEYREPTHVHEPVAAGHGETAGGTDTTEPAERTQTVHNPEAADSTDPYASDPAHTTEYSTRTDEGTHRA
jgi:hypothetical protein